MGKKSKPLCCVNGRYRRTIGRFLNAEGRIAPKKFLLGTDRVQAEIANLKLEHLWAEVVAAHEREVAVLASQWKERQGMISSGMIELIPTSVAVPFSPTHLAETQLNSQGAPKVTEPLWTETTLAIAEVLRKGQTAMVVERGHLEGAETYAGRLLKLQRDFKGVQFVPADPACVEAAQEKAATLARVHALISSEAAALANIPVPKEVGQTLYSALDAYSAFVLRDRVRGGQPTPWAKVLSRDVLRLKDAIHDLPLGQFGYNEIEMIRQYWARRPARKGTSKPISIETVRNMVKVLRQTCQWMHRNPAIKWRKPEDADQAWKCDYSKLMSDHEIAGLKNGVATYSVEELTLLWRHATNHGRVLIALALNCGFSRAECVSLRQDEVDLKNGPKIKRVRRKSRVYGEFALWDETVQALNWIDSQRPKAVAQEASGLYLVTSQGAPFTEQRLTNLWNRTLERVRRVDPTFRRLGFKYLRKTAAQLVRSASDGETAGVFLCHGTPVKTDELADVYSNRDFLKVFAVGERVRKRLDPVFRAAPDAFASAKPSRGGRRTPSTIVQRMVELRATGLPVKQIAAELGLSMQTVYVHLGRNE